MNRPDGERRLQFSKIAAATLLVGGLVVLAVVVVCNVWIIAATKSQVFYEINSVPFNNDGLVPATGRLIEKGRVNQHFLCRVDAAAALYHAGRVKRLILSGDKGHDEPMEMKRALLQRGVPESALVLDNYGLRTLDSVVRARDVFKCGKLTVISERFHDFRALFLSRYLWCRCGGVCAGRVIVPLDGAPDGARVSGPRESGAGSLRVEDQASR